MSNLGIILITLTLYVEFGENYPQGITLNYKPNRPFYATGWTNRPSQLIPPGTPWPASIDGYTSTTTGKPWWATPATEEIAANAVSISSETPTSPSTTTSTTTTTTTTTTTPAPPPPSPTTIANRIDLGSTIATKVPPVQASTEGMLFTSAPEAAGGGAAPQSPPRQGSWSRPSKPASTTPSNFPPRASSSSSAESTTAAAAPPPVQQPSFPQPNNLTLMVEPLHNPDPAIPSASTFTPEASSSTSKITPSGPTSTVVPKIPSTLATTVNVPSSSDSDLDLNSRFSRPALIESESQEGPDSSWVWEFHQGDGKTWSGEFYDSSAISLDFK